VETRGGCWDVADFSVLIGLMGGGSRSLLLHARLGGLGSEFGGWFGGFSALGTSRASRSQFGRWAMDGGLASVM